MNAQHYLQQLVAIPSTRGDEEAVADYLEPLLESWGFTLEHTNRTGRRNIFAIRGEQPSFCGYGHMDTVPIYGGWHTDPLQLTRRGDRLYGLGAHDMKGGIAALLAAVERLPRTVPLKLLFCFDEEYDSEGAWQAVTEHTDWFDGVSHILSVEAGTALNDAGEVPALTLGRRGRARYTVDITGFSAHGGNTERGISAISLAAKLVQRIEAAPMATHLQLGTGSQFVAGMQSQTAGLSVPDHCQLEIERHFVTSESPESILAQYQQVCDELLQHIPQTPAQRALVHATVCLKARTYPYMEAYVTPEDDDLAQCIMRHMDQLLGGHAVAYGRSVADENIFANTLHKQAIVLGPAGGNEHSPDEWVSATALADYTELYSAIIQDWAGQQG